ncbi:MAG TPA: hypothetical protein VHI52_06850, partial [Verrucomicrobiae bacterium]|nr:hypothetical protein [Verrucomicrobiae bacterium]
MRRKSNLLNWRLCFILVVVAPIGATASPSNDPGPAGMAVPANTVRSIVLPHFEPELPLAGGRDDYLSVCVSCHSPRYVMMQPFFPQSKWEETVDKMAKVYGAQMDQEQRTSIVQYLVTTHGPDSARVSARDEDSDFGPAARPAARNEITPSLSLATDPIAR